MDSIQESGDSIQESGGKRDHAWTAQDQEISKRIGIVMMAASVVLFVGMLVALAVVAWYFNRANDETWRVERFLDHRLQVLSVLSSAREMGESTVSADRELWRQKLQRDIAVADGGYRLFMAGENGAPAVPLDLKPWFFGPKDRYDAMVRVFFRQAGNLAAAKPSRPLSDLVATVTQSFAAMDAAQIDLTRRYRHFAKDRVRHTLIVSLGIASAGLFFLVVLGGFALRKLLEPARRALEDGRIAHRRMAAIIDSVEDGILELNAQGDVIFANRSARQFLGLTDMSAFQGSVSSLLTLAGENKDVLRSAFGGGKRTSASAVLLSRPDGTCFQSALTLSPLENGGGAILAFRDVTRHLHREERLRKLSHAVEYSPSPVMITDFTGVIEYVNPAFTTVSGWRVDEVVGRSPRMISSGAQKPEVYREMWRTLHEGRPWRGDFCNRRKDGGHYWVRSAIAPIEDENGTITHFVAIQEDITTEVQALRDLEESRRHLREAVGSLPQGFAIYGPDEKLLMYNDSYRALYPYAEKGRGFEEIMRLGVGDGQISGVAEDVQVEDYVQDRLDVFRRGGSRELSLSDGRWILVSETLTQSGDHACLRTDITSMKRIQEELRTARMAADKANAAKSRFLSSVSHELRTPLNAILGFAQLLQMNRKTPLTDRQAEQVKQIWGAGQHLLTLIDEILDLAKIESGRVSLSIGAVVVNDVLDECQSLMQPTADQAGITLRVERRGGDGLMVRADRMRLKQVLLNLLSNAVKYNSEKGTVWLRVQVEEQSGRVEDGVDGVVVFTVADTGIGIPPSMKNELFQPFNRLGRDQSSIEGTGIGLSLTNQLVTLMGAHLQAEDNEGGGTRFIFALPRVVSMPPPPEKTSQR